MEITEIKVFPVDEEKLKAFVSIVFDRCFMVNDIKVIQGREGLFISMPSRRKRNGRFKDVAHPLNNETRRMIEDRILADYDMAISGEERQVEPVPIESAPVVTVDAVTTEEDSEPAEDKTLEEVAEMHLRDSFWNS
jgi:stage V sporulation protein G